MVSESLLETVLLSDRTPTSIDLKRLVSTYAEPGSRTEVVALEFKEGFDRSGRAWLVLLKELVAMSNSGGGLVVFGIRNDGSRVGCDA